MLLVPWWQWRTETVDYITQQQNNLRPIDVVMANSDQYVSQKEQVLVQSQAWQKLVFSKSIGATEIALQRFIESEATANLLKIQTRRIKSGSINAFLNETVMTIRAEGPLDGIERLVAAIEAYEKRLLVKKFTIQARSYQSKDNLMVQLDVAAYSNAVEKKS